MDLINGLNDKQKEVVLSDSKVLRIIAGAGSGKTKVLTSRIAYLIREKNVYENKILAITFTNKAANEMKERVKNILNTEFTNVMICTIHSLCVRILREDIGYLKYPRNFLIIDSEDQKSILKKIYKELDIDKNEISYSMILNYIFNNKAAEISMAKAEELAYGNRHEINKVNIYRRYIEELDKLMALDFDDLLFKTRELFKKHKEVSAKWGKRFQYIHVDEFQDVDNIQYDIVKLLINDDSNLYVVGDPDQTIYTWRGADVSIIMNFEKDFDNVHTVILNQNYRSTSEILDASNSVIKNNDNRIKKELVSSGTTGPKPIYRFFDSEEFEAGYLVEKITELKHQGIEYKDIGILYRANYLSRNIEKRLIEHQIPYLIYGGVRFYERQEIKDSLSFLRMVLVNDDLAFNRIINNPKRGIGQKTLDTILEKANFENTTMYEVIKNHRLFTGKVQTTLDAFVKMIEDFKEHAEHMTIEDLLNYCLDKSGYLNTLRLNNEDTRIDNIKELVGDIKKFEQEYPDSQLDEYLQLVALYGDKSQYESGDFVQLMTIHSSKGLEFNYVFVVGLSDGVFPSERSLAEGMSGLEEERRLMYVAMTRAKKELYLTEAGGYSYVLNQQRKTSRFIKEIDEEYLEVIKPKTQVSNQDKFKSYDFDTPSFNKPQAPQKRVRYRKGDKVEHTMYGEGIIIAVEDNNLKIAFAFPYGIKKIVSTFAGIKKI